MLQMGRGNTVPRYCTYNGKASLPPTMRDVPCGGSLACQSGVIQVLPAVTLPDRHSKSHLAHPVRKDGLDCRKHPLFH